VKALVAWRLLTHDKGRNALAIGGILLAILLIFLQLGFYMSVPKGGLLFYDAMRFDLVITSSAYVFEAQPGSFPRRRLYQALALPEVTAAFPVYHGSGRWLDPAGGMARDVFVIGFNPRDGIFNVGEIERQTELLRRPDTVLVDTDSRPEFGPLRADREIEIEQRRITIGGTYHLGTGFVGLGVALTSDLNFERIFPQQALSDVNLGLLTLRGDADPDQVARRLREILAPDTQVFTRAELFEHETSHWVTRTSTGLIFGFGVIVAVVVGLVILNQTLSTQITRQLPQYATLKAMGYTDRDLSGIVVTLALIMSTIGFVPATAMAVAIYAIVRRVTMLPIEMTSARMLAVFAIAWTISVLSALLALRVMRRADPVDLF
jgi:putative ABC transport system permease protein